MLLLSDCGKPEVVGDVRGVMVLSFRWLSVKIGLSGKGLGVFVSQAGWCCGVSKLFTDIA